MRTGEDLVALDALETEIEEFKTWAEAGISELARLASEEGVDLFSLSKVTVGDRALA